ncbi:hypothetical protein PSACC_02745 [Paramicrosporidium saccamoebae]|uniref:RRM domain-containing protein n=1 Tax=Paramicrosporidium saccamoebae TaxID=1246581 RepID=A0A2H9TI48_9FUNG|nr:hypothetical protein PSACC_02745 [Paramicrosporidium saccamoebae]
MALFRIGPSPVSNANVPATTPLAAIAQLAPAHMVSSMAIFQRIYVGSIQFDISDADLTLLFSQFGPVRSVSMMQDPVNRRHRGYGFIEFETAEAAALAQEQMEGAELGGRAIRVGRPNNFPADLPPGVPRPVEGRIYVANVHEMVKEEELRMVVEAFGRVRHCHLVPDEKTGKHRGYAYVEYEDEGCANSAIFSLNNFELAKRLLKVGRTISGGPIPHGMESLKNTPISPPVNKVPTAVLRAAQQINSGTLSNSSNSGNSGNSSNSASPLETSVMVLRNLEDYSTLAEDPEAIPELEVDVSEECSKFGPVICCQAHLEHDDKTVKVFVKFSTATVLEEAIRVMHLRWFGGRQIIAEPYDEQRFQTEYKN